MATIRTDIEILLEFGAGLIEDIKTRHRAAGQRASGETEDSLRQEAKGTTVNIIGSSVFNVLDKNRGPTRAGGRSGGKSVRERIYDWLGFRKYGLTFQNDKERVSLSFAIATNIHKFGNFARVHNLESGVISNVATPDRIRAFVNTFGRNAGARLASEIRKAYAA